MSQATRMARKVLDMAAARGVMIATAESCTGGLIAAELTGIVGSSSVMDCGFVTYSNEAKIKLLGVEPELLNQHGAVSAPIASAMAQGALVRSQADLAISVTGIAGPGGGAPDKPTGLIWFGLARTGNPVRTVQRRFGDSGRSRVRALGVETALGLLLQGLSLQPGSFGGAVIADSARRS